MSDDLIERLRGYGDGNNDLMDAAADRIEELEQLFDLRWAADMRAIKAWQVAHPDQPKTWPDHADLGVWCLSRIEKLEAARDGAYTERNRLVAFLASIYPSGVKKTVIPGWDEAWHGCVYIDFPIGQASWHFHDNEAHLFAHLPPYDGEWDGHTTEEKYERLVFASSHAKQTDKLLVDYIKLADILVPHTEKQNDRIKKLEAALREIIVHCEVPAPPNAEALIMFARKALEGKDD